MPGWYVTFTQIDALKEINVFVLPDELERVPNELVRQAQKHRQIKQLLEHKRLVNAFAEVLGKMFK